MNTTTLTTNSVPFTARAVLRAAEHLAHGRLRITLPDGARLDFGPGGAQAEMSVRDWNAFGRIVRSGDIGFAEGYLAGEWSTTHLPGLLRLLAVNREALAAPIYGSAAGRMMHRFVHWMRSNTRIGSARNIAAHYDLGNDFYSLWLDPGMTYSSALYAGDASLDLEGAQNAKYDRILDRLALPAGSHILEIGCGWGGFAERAALRGLRVHGVTLSREQLAFAEQRIASRGLARYARFEYRDYRDLHLRYDAVVSIEMIEAVGERWWPAYFAQVSRSLAPGGRAMIQSIVIDDALFDRYRRGSDFIQQYIFPGGMLPSAPRLEAVAARAGLDTRDRFLFGLDYAHTLAIWRDRFLARARDVRALGFDERFMRMWEFYLAYCEAGFHARSTDVAHFELVRR